MKILSHLKTFFIGLIIGIIAVFCFNTFYLAKNTISLDQLFQENIEYKFYAYATKITGKQRLQVAKLQETEIFERKSEYKAFWISLPDVVVRAKVPVEYNFFVDMTQGWKFQQKSDDEVWVEVPELTNSTPAVDISHLSFDVVKGSVLRNEKEAVEAIQNDLMGMLVEKSIEHRQTVREQARSSIEQFINGWLAQVTGQPPRKLRVRFAGEPDPAVLPNH